MSKTKFSEVIKILKEAEKMDLDPSTGKLFAYVYETGNRNLKKLALEAMSRFYEKNCLDFTVFRSVIFFEKEVIKFAKELMNADSNVVGTYTFGGTESIMLAVKSAREYFKIKNLNKEVKPEIIAPLTIHPAFSKACEYLGMEIKKIPVGKDCKVIPEIIEENITDRTALIALSAPNWSFGTIDPVEKIAPIAKKYKIPLHIDACLGGFILPFLEKIGEKIPLFDFRVEGVTSISLDLHKYGYAPKGASVVLFKNSEYKKHSVYIDVSSPGYVFVNQAVLSSRPAGPLACAFAVIKYLGKEGYEKLAKKIIYARNKIYEGMKKYGFESVCPLESNILSLYSEHDLLNFVVNMKNMGWQIHLQRSIEEYGIPLNIHLAISPVHADKVKEFLSDAKKALKIKSEFANINVEKDMQKIISAVISGKLDAGIIPLLINYFQKDVAIELIKNTVIDWFKDDK